ncbi:hypothetical protein ARNL5_03029 [Anaerolineae bacterium]|nr:hypothetical protein ARNL5_03029 [Anaerolineae bacterium]
MPTIVSITYRPEEHGRLEKGYDRVPLQKAMLISEYGIEHDCKGGNPQRNLNVMDALTQSELTAEGIPTGVGVLGENMIIDGIDLRTVIEGTRLRLGAEAIIELIKLRNGCQQLTTLDARLPEHTRGRLGYMCRVVQSGPVQVGDPVEIIP